MDLTLPGLTGNTPVLLLVSGTESLVNEVAYCMYGVCTYQVDSTSGSMYASKPPQPPATHVQSWSLQSTGAQVAPVLDMYPLEAS